VRQRRRFSDFSQKPRTRLLRRREWPSASLSTKKRFPRGKKTPTELVEAMIFAHREPADWSRRNCSAERPGVASICHLPGRRSPFHLEQKEEKKCVEATMDGFSGRRLALRSREGYRKRKKKIQNPPYLGLPDFVGCRHRKRALPLAPPRRRKGKLMPWSLKGGGSHRAPEPGAEGEATAFLSFRSHSNRLLYLFAKRGPGLSAHRKARFGSGRPTDGAALGYRNDCEKEGKRGDHDVRTSSTGGKGRAEGSSSRRNLLKRPSAGLCLRRETPHLLEEGGGGGRATFSAEALGRFSREMAVLGHGQKGKCRPDGSRPDLRLRERIRTFPSRWGEKRRQAPKILTAQNRHTN